MAISEMVTEPVNGYRTGSKLTSCERWVHQEHGQSDALPRDSCVALEAKIIHGIMTCTSGNKITVSIK